MAIFRKVEWHLQNHQKPKNNTKNIKKKQKKNSEKTKKDRNLVNIV